MAPKQKNVSVRAARANYNRLVLLKAFLIKKTGEDLGFNEAIGELLDSYESHTPKFRAFMAEKS